MRFGRQLAAGLAALLLTCAAPAAPLPRRQIVDVGKQWDPFSDYLQRMMAGIQKKWDAILADRAGPPPSGGFVAVKFSLDAQGRVSNILDVGDTSTPGGEASCLTALTLAAPFGPWPAPMLKALGPVQEVTMRFYL